MTKTILHHGLCKQEIIPQYVGTDYFAFNHIPCTNKEPEYGHCEIIKVLIDNDGRIIFNLKCQRCGFTDALKTSATLWVLENREKPLKEIFQLSPNLKECIGRHRWDNL
jgi:hypothetical protein